jgi:hypothetical protein
MIGVPEYDLRTHLAKLARRNCFHRSLSSHRHENGRQDFSPFPIDARKPNASRSRAWLTIRSWQNFFDRKLELARHKNRFT